MPHDYNQPFRNRLATGSYYMDPEEIDSILRIQWKSLHSGSPYVEDYYYLVSQLGVCSHFAIPGLLVLFIQAPCTLFLEGHWKTLL